MPWNSKEKQNAYKRKLYRKSPEYQQKARDAAKARYEKLKNDPIYGKILQYRKDLRRLKDSYEARMKHAQHLERRMVQVGIQLRKLEEQWKSSGLKK